MIDFDVVIQYFGPKAVALQVSEAPQDWPALKALADTGVALSDRSARIKRWLQFYEVFQGITTAQREAIATAVVTWADSRALQRDLTTVDALDTAHAELMGAVCNAFGKKRDFTSLASKALWLCYPDSVPLFDSYAQRALWVIGKVERGTIPLPNDRSEYRKFVHVWKALYERHSAAIKTLDHGVYPYPVRIFDKILWLIGERQYETTY